LFSPFEAVYFSLPSRFLAQHFSFPSARFVTYLGVAQFGRALRLGRRGRMFKSCHRDHYWPIAQW
jgi:hypothetical protein